MKSVHVWIDEDLYKEIETVFKFHGGISAVVRIALKNFTRDIKNGKIKLGGADDARK